MMNHRSNSDRLIPAISAHYSMVTLVVVMGCTTTALASAAITTLLFVGDKSRRRRRFFQWTRDEPTITTDSSSPQSQTASTDAVAQQGVTQKNDNETTTSTTTSPTFLQQWIIWLGKQIHLTLYVDDTNNDDPNSSSRDQTSRLQPYNKQTKKKNPKDKDFGNDTDGNQTDRDRIRNNQQQIHSVLSFWFGQCPSIAQKQLWMISVQNKTLIEKVDVQIASQFGYLLLQLSKSGRHQDDADDDKTNKPSMPTYSDTWQEWCHEIELYGIWGLLAAIIVLDQFSRHIHRLLQRQDIADSPLKLLNPVLRQKLMHELPHQSILDTQAYQTALLLHESMIGTPNNNNNLLPSLLLLTVPMRIFALMPFRHQSTIDSVQLTLKQIETLSDYETQCSTLISSFRKATHRRLAILQDEERRTGGSKKRDGNGNHTNGNDVEGRQASSITEFTDEDILECGPFAADLSAAPDHVVYRTIRDFLTTEGIIRSPKEKPQQSTHHHPIVVSLSGGVDSMVIAAVLAHLQQQPDGGCNHFSIVAAHIDYANRPESMAEATFVEHYCQQFWPNIAFRCRRIDEVTRGITARDDYERIAREIRYSFYRDTVKESLLFCDGKVKEKDVGVVLGHHRGDLRENVLSNAHKGCGPLDLSGMTATSYNDGVTLFRPLLPLEKHDIFDYAHKFGVPYFKDTTPHWSTRGKLRNKLLPLLQEIYGEGSMNNLSNLAVESDACRALMHKAMIQPFLDGITFKPMGIYFPTAQWRDQGPFFWNVVLREALHSAGLGMFTDKSVDSFMKRACCLDGKPIHEGWLQCRKDYAVYLRSDGTVFVLYPKSFPWHKNNQYACLGQSVDYGLEYSVHVGPWKLTAELCSGVDNTELTRHEMQLLLDRKVYTSMEMFMEGSLEYYLEIATWRADKSANDAVPFPLIFRRFHKSNRPRAWKGIDTKIQDTLPLLGFDDDAANGMEREHDSKSPTRCLVKVSLSLSDGKLSS